MRSKWLGLGLGILTLIGCNALWQGYLSPLDDVTDASINNSDLTGADLTGVPPADLTGADLTGVDLTGAPPVDMAMGKLCGFASAPSGTYRYAAYSTLQALTNYQAQKVAVVDVDNDGLAEVAVADLNSAAKILKLRYDTATSCSVNRIGTCDSTGPSWDIQGLTVSSTVGTFLIARNNNNNTAITTCSGATFTPKNITSTGFGSSCTIRDLTVPPAKTQINSQTNAVAIFHEKCKDPTGDRLTSLKFNPLDLSTVTTLPLSNITVNGNNFEPRWGNGARIDEGATDSTLDAIAFEVQGSTAGRLVFYNNNLSTSPAVIKATVPVTASVADSNDLTFARLTADTFDDAIAISRSTNQITPYHMTALNMVTVKSPIMIPSGSNDKSKIMFADLNNDGLDELIVVNGTNISLYGYNSTNNTLTGPQNLAVKPGYTAVSIALGYLEKGYSSSGPDIFVVSSASTNLNEVGVFRYVPMGVAP